MRLGAPLASPATPEDWIISLRTHGYRAAYCPIDASADSHTRRAYAQAAEQADIVIAEVGVWNNPLSPVDATRRAAFEKCTRQLALADEIGARCCVNLSGTLSTQWNEPHPDNLTAATFDLIVESVRQIIDTVQPTRTFYTLETMPYLYPDSVDCYLELIKAIDRPAFAVHLDLVNLISSPQLYYNHRALIEDAFVRLGAHIKSCHAKDITLEPRLTVHLTEVVPGKGMFDYPTFLAAAHNLDKDMPIMLEHLPAEDYPAAAEYVRAVARSIGVPL